MNQLLSNPAKSNRFNPAPAMQPIASAELQSITGGLGVSINVSGMPDRTVMCGTMWVLDQLFRRLGQGRI